MHHVAVTVEHRDGAVTSVDARGVRLPWSLCPGAMEQLQELVGAPTGVTPRVAEVSAHCTHFLDCASSAIRFAGSDTAMQRYELWVSGWDGVADAIARSDDGRELAWRTDGTSIVDPPEHRGPLGTGFTKWATASLDPDLAEMAIWLRRTVWMRASPSIDLDDLDVLRESGLPESSCYASQPHRIDVAIRNRGASLPDLPT